MATDLGDLSLDVVMQPGEIIVADVWGPVGPLFPSWTEVQVDLSAFSGQTVQLRFRTTTAANGSQPMCFDDVLVYDHLFGNGQPPRPGIAEFDLNNSTSLGFNPVSSLENGPYFTAATPGDLLTFDFDGAANAPVLLLHGPLSPQIATYGPGIGQLDIGGPLDPVTGIPTGIFVLFDGNLPGGLNHFFRTSPAGSTCVFLGLPAFPPGVLTTFQSVLLDPTTGGVACSNAIQLTVN